MASVADRALPSILAGASDGAEDREPFHEKASHLVAVFQLGKCLNRYSAEFVVEHAVGWNGNFSTNTPKVLSFPSSPKTQSSHVCSWP